MEKTTKQVSIRFIIAVSFFVLALIIFSLLARIVVIGQKDLFDQRAFDFFDRISTPAFIEAMRITTFFGSSTFLFPAYLVIIAWLLVRKKKTWALDIGIVALTGDLMKGFLKLSFARPRPELPLIETLSSYSFPSGHALSSFIFSSALIYLLWNGSYSNITRWIFTPLLLLFAFAVGISRIVLRFHYASDVIAGFCMAYVWVIFCLWLMDRVRKKKGAAAAA